ncbi:TolC family protein [Acuticoccus kandeliae]|uniref:TolC family protein n=1 Tax=Acuticoccus kandeliae TaxID=2073160 RepID=UPI000D3E73A8|nr:TolC family protein [Acuticoccus kandeliae]
MRRLAHVAGASALAGLLAGCVSPAEFPVDRGFVEVSNAARPVTKTESSWATNAVQQAETETRVRALVAGRTIDIDTAVKVALLNNRELQADYADLGIAFADLWQESLPVNPAVSVGTSLNVMTQALEGLLIANILSYATRERRVAIAETRARQAQSRAVEKTLALALETRRAWVEAAAAWGVVGELNQALTAADAAAELSVELGRTGAFPKIEQARNQAFYAELTAEKARAVLAARLAKEKLTRLLGLWGANLTYEVPNGLPSLPRGIRDESAIERAALQNRVDLKIAKLELEALARSYGLTKATRYLTDLQVVAGVEWEREESTSEDHGKEVTEVEHRLTPRLEVEFEIPIFDTGAARMRKANLEIMRATNLLAARAVAVRSEARAAHLSYRGSYDIARHYRDAVVPLRKAVEDESLLNYNGMITSTFDLLADTRARIESARAALDARRDFYLAEIDVTAAIWGGGVAGAAPAETATAQAEGAAE